MINIYTNNYKNKKYKGSRVLSLKKQNTNNKINKLESVPFDITNSVIQDTLDISDFQRKRRKLGRYLSEKGDAAMFIFPHMDMMMIGVLKDIRYSIVGKMEMWVEGTTEATYTYDDVDLPIITRIFYNDQNKPTLSRYVVLEDNEKFVIEEDYVYENMVRLPVEVFYNNEEKQDDITYAGVWEDLDRLDYLDSELRSEFELQRNLTSFNTNFTDNDPRKENDALRDGKGFMEETSWNAKLREGTGIIPSNGSILLHKQLVNDLENDIRNRLGLKLMEGQEKGTNKHNLEMVTKEEFALEQLLMEQSMREIHWQQFFNKLADVLNQERINIKLNISPLQQAKLDILEATVASEMAKATTPVQTQGE